MSGLSAVHDVAGGGLGVALAEVAAASGVGVRVSVDGAAELFTEAPGRFLVATADAMSFVARAAALGVDAEVVGVAEGDALVVDGLLNVPVAELGARLAGALPEALGVA